MLDIRLRYYIFETTTKKPSRSSSLQAIGPPTLPAQMRVLAKHYIRCFLEEQDGDRVCIRYTQNGQVGVQATYVRGTGDDPFHKLCGTVRSEDQQERYDKRVILLK